MKVRVEELFHEVADLSSEARARYFAEHGVDEDTRHEVEALLAFDAGATEFLQRDIGFAASRALAQLEATGGRCGPYQLLRLIGRGGMGLVYLAERSDGEVRQQAAVKLLRAGGDSAAARRRFLQERQILANLSHPNIARLLDAGHREDGQPYLVMEYIAGQPIDDYCESLALRPKVELLALICEAVSYAHQKLVIHRDLKPGNILVGPDGIPKLLDFGIAKLLDAASEATATLDRRLTPVYASPEQVRGQPVGMATDIYSLGAILYKLLTGRGPFQSADGMTPAGLEAAICEKELIRPSRLHHKIDRDLDAIVLKAMRKEPGERYATASQLGGDLKAWLERRPVRARQGDQWYLAKRLVRTRWAPLAAAVALSGLAGGLLVARHERAVTARPFEVTTTTKLTNTGESLKAAISPDGRYIAHTLITSGEEALRVRRAMTLQDIEIVPPGPVRYVGNTFSPDSETIYYVTRTAGDQPHVLYRIPVSGGSGQKLKEGLDSPVTFSPNGREFAFVRESASESTLLVADLDSGAEQRLVSHKLPEILDYPAWSPDGRIIACTAVDSSIASSKGSGARIIGVRVADRIERKLSGQTWGYIRQLAWLGDGHGLVMSARSEESGLFHIWHVSYPHGVGQELTNGVDNQTGASVSADSRQIVTVEESTFSSIWRMPATQYKDPEPVVSGASDSSTPAWTPDGRIIFEQELNGHRSIWTAAADGTNQKQLTMTGNNYYPSISGDGRRIAYLSERNGSPAIWTMDIDGGNQAMVAKGDWATAPQLSPDGKWIVFTAGGSGRWPTLQKVASNGGPAIELNDKLWRRPAISPDGKWIAGFYADQQLSTQREPGSIAVIPIEGGQPWKVIPSPPSVSLSAGLRWSPDGRQLLYVDRRKDGANIWSQPLTGGAPHQVTQFHGDALFSFDWSRDGKQLAFSRGIQARDVVLIQDAKSFR